MEHILEHFLYSLDGNFRGFIFGFVHVGIMILGYYSGWSLNRFLNLVSTGYIAGIFGAAVSQILADLIASLIDPHVRYMVVGIVVGGLGPLAFLPLLEKYVVKSQHHIVVGDHDEVKKDLDSHQ